MSSSFKSSRNEILEKLGVSDKINEIEFDKNAIKRELYPPLDKDLLTEFRTKFEDLSGNLIVCESEEELNKNLSNFIKERGFNHVLCLEPKIKSALSEFSVITNDTIDNYIDTEASITYCEALVARTGSVLVSSAGNSGRKLNIIPDVHIIIAYKKQLFAYIEDATDYIQKKYDSKLPSLTVRACHL